MWYFEEAGFHENIDFHNYFYNTRNISPLFFLSHIISTMFFSSVNVASLFIIIKGGTLNRNVWYFEEGILMRVVG